MAATKKSQRGPNNPSWKGGRHVDSRGYVSVVVEETDEIGMAMVKKRLSYSRYGWTHMQEHRLVMAHSLGRPLTSKEVVHHINGDKTDNRIENLMLMPSRSEHIKALHLEVCPNCGYHLRSAVSSQPEE